jgi:hypothetical protein
VELYQKEPGKFLTTLRRKNIKLRPLFTTLLEASAIWLHAKDGLTGGCVFLSEAYSTAWRKLYLESEYAKLMLQQLHLWTLPLK